MNNPTISILNVPRHPHEYDVTALFLTELMEQGIQSFEFLERFSYFREAFYIPGQQEPNEYLQRFLMNRVLRLYLGSLDRPTIQERLCLVDDGSTQDWLDLMERIVIPSIVKIQQGL